jgi:hypothetical protein
MKAASASGTGGLVIALGRCADERAEVFVRPAGGPLADGCRIVGTLAGPRRGRDTTLPVTVRLQPTVAGGPARAILTEPAYWTPGLPNLYRLEARLEGGAEPACATDRLVGLRRFGVRGRSLWLDGHRWVPRAVAASGSDALAACKAAAVAAVITEPDEPLLAQADAIGVAVVAVVSSATSADPAAVVAMLAAWAAHPAAVVAVLPAGLSPDLVAAIALESRPRRDTLLLAATVAGAVPPPASIPAGVDVLAVAFDPGGTPHEAWREGAAVPLVAWRREPTMPAMGRGPCDALQATLAAWGIAGGRDRLVWDWAGYVVA